MNNIDIYRTEINNWINILGLPQYQPHKSELEEILSLTRSNIRQRSNDQLAEDAFIVHQYSYYLQQKINECDTFIKWANSVLSKLLNEDHYRMVHLIKKAELRLTRVQYMARRVEMIGQSLSLIIRTRKNDTN